MTNLRKAAEMLMKALDDGWVERGDNVAIVLRQALAQPEQDDDAYEYAKRLAECIWEKYYKEESPHWRPFHDVLGVLTQIDNMTCGLEKAQPEQEPVALKQLREVHEVQGLKGNWDFDPYMRGLYNGLELALSLFEKRDPVYKAPISEPVKERISEPVANLEPVAWVSEQVLDKQFMPDGSNRRVWWEMSKGVGIPFYTAPPKREWVGLTNEEVDAIRNKIFEKYKKALFVTRDVTSENDYSAFNFYQAIEEKLRSKNDI